jgi:hypothetical protein
MGGLSCSGHAGHNKSHITHWGCAATGDKHVIADCLAYDRVYFGESVVLLECVWYVLANHIVRRILLSCKTAMCVAGAWV